MDVPVTLDAFWNRRPAQALLVRGPNGVDGREAAEDRQRRTSASGTAWQARRRPVGSAAATQTGALPPADLPARHDGVCPKREEFSGLTSRRHPDAAAMPGPASMGMVEATVTRAARPAQCDGIFRPRPGARPSRFPPPCAPPGASRPACTGRWTSALTRTGPAKGAATPQRTSPHRASSRAISRAPPAPTSPSGASQSTPDGPTRSHIGQFGCQSWTTCPAVQ